VVLKMRDQGLGMPAAAVLVSPWLDVTPSGDTETTLRYADPNLLYEKHGKQAAAAFADPGDQKDPYVSPVYGDYSTGFPPTLIQGGLKETLLSGFVRLYQALDVAGVPVKLDLYEGMIITSRTESPMPGRRSWRAGKFGRFYITTWECQTNYENGNSNEDA
jgi:epsilon-lactone hydrolase